MNIAQRLSGWKDILLEQKHPPKVPGRGLNRKCSG